MVASGLSDAQFQKLSTFIETEVGIRMPPAKRIMLESRLQKRLRALSMTSYEDYVEHVFGHDTAELVHLIDVVTTNKTDFFRERDHFDYLADVILGDVESSRYGIDEPFTAWSSASSTGEEAYTLAIVFEEIRRRHPRFDYRILATDISTVVLETGRRAIYPESRVEPIPAELRRRYFLRSRTREEALVRVKPELRRRVRFERLNLMAPSYPIRTRFHAIFCRNVIIYFERPRQIALVQKLNHYLRPGGYLFVGHSETLAGFDLPLTSVAPTIYRATTGRTNG